MSKNPCSSALASRAQSSTGVVQEPGLGLYLCKQIVHANHGVIECESAEQAGTRFTIKFPTLADSLKEKVDFQYES